MQNRNPCFFRNNVCCHREVPTKICVPSPYHTSEQRAVVRIVEEPDYLLGDIRPALTAASVRRHYENVRLS